MTVIDHFVIAAPDLDDAVTWFADLTGVTPSAGGAHPGVGTRNALVALDDRTYIELIAPDPAQPSPQGSRPFGIDGLTVPTLTAFAVAPDDIEDAVAKLRTDAGIDLGSVSAMSRRRPDGVELAWRLTRHAAPAGGPLVPFLIDWGDSPHPAATAASGCSVSSVALRSPDAASVAAALTLIGLEIPVEEAAEPEIQLSLESPRGTVAFGPG
jgi:catechol 2,3-dioxygenase-like lactoylglutathione lyase family enzyme